MDQPANLSIYTPRDCMLMWFDVPPAERSGIGSDFSGSVRCSARSIIVVPCDTKRNAQELALRISQHGATGAARAR